MHEAMFNYISAEDSSFNPTKLAIPSTLRQEVDLISNYGENIKKVVSYKNMVCFSDEDNIKSYVDFDCGIYLHASHGSFSGSFHKSHTYQPRTDK